SAACPTSSSIRYLVVVGRTRSDRRLTSIKPRPSARRFRWVQMSARASSHAPGVSVFFGLSGFAGSATPDHTMAALAARLHVRVGSTEAEPRTRNQEPGTGNQEPGTRNQEPGTRNPEPGTENPEPRTRNQEPG